MNNSIYRFTLDIQSIQSQISIPIVFGDTARTLLINLTDGGSPYVIEDGCLAIFSAKRADSAVIQHPCTILNNSVIKYDFNTSTAATEGLVRCEIILYGTEDNIIASPKFSLVVDERVVYNEITEFSSDKWSSIDEMYTDVQGKMSRTPFAASDYGKNVAVGTDGGLVAVDFNSEQTPSGGTGGTATNVDLSEYAKSADVESQYLKKTEASETYLKQTDAASTYQTKAEAQAALAGKMAAKPFTSAQSGQFVKVDSDGSLKSEAVTIPSGGGGSVDIVQTTGPSTTSVMSQNAVSQELGDLDARVDSLEIAAVGGSGITIYRIETEGYNSDTIHIGYNTHIKISWYHQPHICGGGWTGNLQLYSYNMPGEIINASKVYAQYGGVEQIVSVTYNGSYYTLSFNTEYYSQCVIDVVIDMNNNKIAFTTNV